MKIGSPIPTFKEQAIEKLLSNRHINANGCWIWTKGTNDNGYGYVSINGRLYGVHRLAYEVFIKEPKLSVLHNSNCPSRACFNPEHLHEGTPKENMAEMRMLWIKKKDSPKG